VAAALAGVTTPNVAFELPGMVSSHSPFGELAYNFTLEHWDELANIAGDTMWGRFWLLPNAAARFNEPARAAQLIEDQQRKAGADGAMPLRASRLASRCSRRYASATRHHCRRCWRNGRKAFIAPRRIAQCSQDARRGRKTSRGSTASSLLAGRSR
jgi:hypothetical protein